jgi:hypothetical protein
VHVVKSKDPKVQPRLRLAAEWRPPRASPSGALIASGRLWDFTEKIASSRREGKNRRDGATVSTRVLRLTDVLGAQLYEEAKKPDAKGVFAPTLSREEDKQLKRSIKERRRRRSLEGRAHL